MMETIQKKRKEMKEMLTIKGLSVRYKEQLALDLTETISFEQGERIGIIGANGAGKTTLVKAILGLVPYRGQIISAVPQNQMAVHLQGNEYATTMSTRHVIETITNTKIEQDPKLMELIEHFEFEPNLKKKFSALSGGLKQRMTLLLVLHQNRPITFFDEVTSGLDFETRQKLVEKMQGWYKDKQSTLFLVSHYYEELEQFTDKILFLDEGKLIEYGNKDELFRKHCGRAIVVLQRTKENLFAVQAFDQVLAPEHLIALSCQDEQTEQAIVHTLTAQNINYKRSNSDIEIMTINAKAHYYQMQRRMAG